MGEMPDRSSKRPRDLNALAASIAADATDETPDRYTYRVEWWDEDNGWVGLCPELPSLSWLERDIAALHVYNFARPHVALTKAARGRKVTPATPADVEDRVRTYRGIAQTHVTLQTICNVL
ncbi:hypothetical protein [Mycobacterium sp. HUMS_1102779]|uniref:hypothetical protein n=1 Tax=Mycobacterium sp. HUMS_1102779 TaxID=3383487 RepID=UPI00389A3162